MRTVEQFMQGKKNDEALCEDALFIGEHLVAVIDGVTTKGGGLIKGRKSGRFARDVLLESLTAHPDMYLWSAAEALRFLNQSIADAVAQAGVTLQKKGFPRAGIIVFNGYRSEIWNYGDCQGMFCGKKLDYSKKVDEVNSDVRAMYIEAALLNGSTVMDIEADDVGRTAILDNLTLQFEFENIPGPFGYPVLNGLNFNEGMISVESVPPGAEVVLASDGYPVLRPTLSESEAELDKLLHTDPLCFRDYRSTKGLEKGNISFDDRTYWRGFAE